MEEIKYVREILKSHFEDELKTEEENETFFANTCHTCHCLDKLEKRLKTCGSCHMISYCDTEHQAKHWPIHKKLCKIVKQIISTNGGNSIFGNTKGLDQKNWVKLKMNTMLIVSLKIGRKLSSSEKDMFLFPRVCSICHDTNPQALKNCFDCGNSCFCDQHILDTRHKIICPSFALYYKLSLLKPFTKKMLIPEIVSTLLDANPINCIPFANKHVEFTTMKEFIDVFFRQIINDRRRANEVNSSLWEIFISDYFTRPLTLLSAMKLINYEPKSELIIHIIGADFVELGEIFAWEILFHLMGRILEKLTIILIGPEIIVGEKIIETRLCDNCRECGKFIDIVVVNSYYHEFMSEMIAKPNLIVGYNLGISENENPGTLNDTWQLTIFKIAEMKVPFIVTCYTEGEALKDHARICHFLKETDADYQFLQSNKFASLTPHRDFETEGIFYQNNFMIVYNNLQSSR